MSNHLCRPLFFNRQDNSSPTFFVVVQSLSRAQHFATPRTAAHQAPLSSTISQSLLRLISTELVMLSNHLILCCSLLLLPSSFPVSRLFALSGQSIGAASLCYHSIPQTYFSESVCLHYPSLVCSWSSISCYSPCLKLPSYSATWDS